MIQIHRMGSVELAPRTTELCDIYGWRLTAAITQSARLVSTKRSLHSVLFVPDEFAPVLNAIGGYVLAQASAQRLVNRQIATDSPMRGQHE